MTYDQAVDRLVKQGYPQSIEARLNGFVSSPLGFRLGGTAAEHEASAFLADELRAAGLQNVRLEKVPVDVFEPRGASVSVEGTQGRVLTAAQFAGVPGTPANGIRGQVVYVGFGTAADYDGKAVTDSLVLVDHDLDAFWVDWPLAEATARGAAGVIYTAGPQSGEPFSFSPDTLGAQDGMCDAGSVPLVFISREDSDWLKARLAAGPVTATMTSEVGIRMVTEGGFGYNVLGEIPGRAGGQEKVVIAAHQDCHFLAGADDTGAVATAMTVAKALMMSACQLEYTVVFMFTTSEEFGRQGTTHDWQYGAWYSITHTHPDWPGTLAGMINLEVMAESGGELRLNAAPELVSWLTDQVAAAADLHPYGVRVTSPVATDGDDWSFAALGTPTVMLTAYRADYWTRYHTQYDNVGNIDFDYVGQIAKLVCRLAVGLGSGVLPYSLSARCEDLADSVDSEALLAADADAEAVSRLVAAIADFRMAASAYEARRGEIPADRRVGVNRRLMQVERELISAFTALDARWYTIYPHQQLLVDAQAFKEALVALQAAPPDVTGALEALARVDLTREGVLFSHDVYRRKLARKSADYPELCWGALGQLPPFFDVVDEYRRIEGGEGGDVAPALVAMREHALADLDRRLFEMGRVAASAAESIGNIG